MLKRHAFSLSSARNHVFLQTNSLVSDMSTPEKRVLVGMSGGIDSTATCLMLKEQGYEIVGLTMWVWGDEPVEARQLADSMGIEHHVADEREAFRQIIVQNFIDEYCQGRTPNPCVMCNPLFKFRILAEWADKLGCAYIATGHYTRLETGAGVAEALYLPLRHLYQAASPRIPPRQRLYRQGGRRREHGGLLH